MQNRPTNLVLAQFFKGVYADNSACAYIYYGDANDARDHLGNKVGVFMNDDDRLALEKHVTDVIVPVIEKGLARSKFKVLHVDYLNMAPHPYLVIIEKSGKRLDENDLTQLRVQLESIIAKANLPAKKRVRFAPVTLFFEENSTAPASNDNAEPKSHGYNLRPRQ